MNRQAKHSSGANISQENADPLISIPAKLVDLRDALFARSRNRRCSTLLFIYKHQSVVNTKHTSTNRYSERETKSMDEKFSINFISFDLFSSIFLVQQVKSVISVHLR